MLKVLCDFTYIYAVAESANISLGYLSLGKNQGKIATSSSARTKTTETSVKIYIINMCIYFVFTC